MKRIAVRTGFPLLVFAACARAGAGGGGGEAGATGAGGDGSGVNQGGASEGGAGQGGAPGGGGATQNQGGTGAGAGGVAGGGLGGVAGVAGGSTGSAGFGLAGTSRCETAGVPFCENFEAGLSPAVWTTVRVGDGTAVVDEVHAARGSKALHLKTAGTGHAFVREIKSFPAENNTLFARMFVWFDDALTTDGHFTLAEAIGPGTPAMIRFGGQFKAFGVGTDGGPSGDWTDRDSKTIPAKTWICVEFEFNGPANEFRAWRDDVEMTALHVGANRHPNFTMPRFANLWFGWWMYNATEPQDVWIDEIAVDYKPIGCAR